MLNKLRSRHAEYWRVYNAIAADPSVGTLVTVRSQHVEKGVHRTSFVLGLARELPAAFTVFASAASALQGEHDAGGYALAGAEVIAGAAVLISIAFEARHLFGRHTDHAHGAPDKAPRLDVSSLAAAALGYVEAWHHARTVGHFKLVSPYTVGATLSLLVAGIKNRPATNRRRTPLSRRQLHVAITPAGISYLAGPRRKWRAEWTEVAAVEHGRGELALRLHDGRRHVLRADDHLDGEDVLDETRAAIAAHAPHIPGAASMPLAELPR